MDIAHQGKIRILFFSMSSSDGTGMDILRISGPELQGHFYYGT
jgi:hypothetical protein